MFDRKPTRSTLTRALVLVGTTCLAQAAGAAGQTPALGKPNGSLDLRVASAANAAAPRSSDAGQFLPAVPAIASSSATTPAACAVVDGAAVEASLGARLVDVAAGSREAGALAISTCFVRTTDPSRSVSLELASGELPPPGGAAARERWRELFHSERAEESEEPEGGPRQALPVARLGEEAFYVGNAVYGALYVLEGDSYLRLSVGGAGDLPAKLASARTLAELLLPVLPEPQLASARMASDANERPVVQEEERP